MSTGPIAVILAAGKGTRMKSDLAKVLHPLRGRPLLEHVLAAASRAGAAEAWCVVGHQADRVREIGGSGATATRAGHGWLRFATQAEQNGTGHAVQCALAELGDPVGRPVWILSGDVPCLTAATLKRLADACAESSAGMALATFEPASPDGYGRIIRNGAGHATAIVEHADASPAQREIRECNAGVYCMAGTGLREELAALGSDNAAGEIYLTDLVARRAAAGAVLPVVVDAEEVAGINTTEQLEALEASWRGPGDA